MSAKPNLTCALFLIVMLSAIWFVNGCGDERDPVGPTPEPSKIRSLGMLRTDWTLASTPRPLVGDGEYTRGTMHWHNPPPIAYDDVYNTDVAAGHGSLQPLRIIFRPHGGHAAGPPDDPCFMWFDTKSWGGIMTAWDAGLPDGYEQGESVFLEMRLRPASGLLHIEFGRQPCHGTAFRDIRVEQLDPCGPVV